MRARSDVSGDLSPQEPLDAAPPELFSVDAGELLRAIRARPWLIGICAILGAAAGGLNAWEKPRIYAAAAEIVIDPVLPKVLGDSFDVEDGGDRLGAQASFYNTQYQIIQSRKVYREAVARLGFVADEKFLADYGINPAADEDARIKAGEGVFRRIVLVAPDPKSRIVKLIVEDFDPDRAARIANAIADVYIDHSLKGRMETTTNAYEWLDAQSRDFGTKLEDAEKALADFKRSNTLVSVSLEDRKNMIGTGMTAFNDKLVEVRNRLIALRAEREVIQAAAARGREALLATPRVAASDSVRELRNSLVDLEKRRAELSSRYGEKHPNMQAVDAQVGRVDKLLTEEIQALVVSVDNEIAALDGTERSLRGAMDVEIKKAMDLNNLALEYAKLSREVAKHQKTFESLDKRRTETNLSGKLDSNFVSLHQAAEPNPRKIRPSTTLEAVIGGVLGLLLGLALVVGRVLLDNTIHTQAEVEERLRLAFLGLLPKIEQEAPKRGEEAAAARSRDLYIAHNPKSAVAECARSLRTNLMFLGAETDLKRILLTSAGPSEGKSTTAIALGTTMALAKKRVLVIDTDLRRPRLHKAFGVSSREGLTSVLVDECGLDQAIKSTEVVGLDVLPCGPLPPNPSELLHTERFERLLRQLDERYDRIVLDSPPVNAVTDASILSQLSNGTILVVKASKTSKEAARRAARQLADVRANVLGVVLNDVDLKQGTYYRDQYYQYYRSGYAYGSDAEGRAEV